MITIKIEGSEKLAEASVKIRKLKEGFNEQLLNIANRFGLNAITTSRDKYFLKGGGVPKPDKLTWRSGRLGSSIKMHPPKLFKDGVDITIYSNVVYAPVHEKSGHIPSHDIYPRKKKVLSWISEGKRFFSKHVEFPGAFIKTRPFLRPALEDCLPQLKKDIGGMLGQYGK